MSALGYDPTPGEPDGVRRVAALFGTVSTTAELANKALHRIAGSEVDDIWTGQAALAFRTTLEQACDDLTKLQHSHDDARAALLSYATALGEAQDIARRAGRDADSAVADRDGARGREHTERTAARALADAATKARARQMLANTARGAAEMTGDLATANLHLGEAERQGRTASEAEAARQDADRRAERAGTDAESADDRFTAARRLAESAAEQRDSAAHRAVRALDEASDEGIQPRNFLERAHDGVIELVTSKGFDEFVDFLSAAGDVLLSLAPVAVIACAAGGFLIGGPAGLAAGLALGATVNRVMTGTGLAFKAAALGGRMAQAAADPGKQGDMIDAGVDMVVTGVTTKLFAGSPKGKPLVSGSELIEGLRDVKRTLSFDNNTHLDGVARKVLWETVEVAPKVTPHFRLLRENAAIAQDAKALLELGAFGADTGKGISKTVEMLQGGDPSDPTSVEANVAENGVDLITDVVVGVGEDVLGGRR
ncbi:hypothetical protein [Actinokineospora sp. NBRC 105648]|uniref:hypothetical protein n=1 Tax=Actinokineospora sp. NBRC 105648 TaxID=3032206 RepID=UPI0024A371B3|nr:hypothetical protein [Actinokineospora sp. NBRC 105648]GLZ40603.1 hypothetical protein Acsp05_42270 [Actinokineospora sp. NBRC 105648]